MTAEVFGVLIVDDEPNIRSGLAKGLSGEATLLATAANADEALAMFNTSPYAVVLADVRLNSRINGIEMLKQMLQLRPRTVVIVITAHGDDETVAQAIQAGAFQVIRKPLDLQLVRRQVRLARELYRLQGREPSSL